MQELPLSSSPNHAIPQASQCNDRTIDLVSIGLSAHAILKDAGNELPLTGTGRFVDNAGSYIWSYHAISHTVEIISDQSDEITCER